MYEQFLFVLYLIMISYLFTCLLGYGCFAIYRLVVSKRSVFENKNYCEVCGESFHQIYSYPIIGYILCLGKCSKCGFNFGYSHLLLESAMFIFTFVIFCIKDLTITSVTICSLYLGMALAVYCFDLKKSQEISAK